MTSAEHERLVGLLERQAIERESRFAVIDRRFDDVDLHLGELRHAMLGHFDEVCRRLERLEQE
jgi:hypothetical protein